jgi:hypothetical protein
MELRLPPFASVLKERGKWSNIPLFVIISAGMNSWQSAKRWNKSPNDINALVLPDGESSKKYTWPVNGCDVFIERLYGPGDEVITDLIRSLLSFGAKIVIVWNKNDTPKFLRYWAKEG